MTKRWTEYPVRSLSTLLTDGKQVWLTLPQAMTRKDYEMLYKWLSLVADADDYAIDAQPQIERAAQPEADAADGGAVPGTARAEALAARAERDSRTTLPDDETTTRVRYDATEV